MDADEPTYWQAGAIEFFAVRFKPQAVGYVVKAAIAETYTA
jgi:hypothetical protein